MWVQVTLLSSSTLCSQTEHYEITKKDLRNPQAKLSQVASKIEFIPLEFNKECLIDMHYGYHVTKAGENWLVSSSFGSGFIFNSQGKYLGKVGQKGKGPGEYTQFHQIMWDKGIEKYLMLMSQNRINIYNPDGSFSHQIKYETYGKIWSIAIIKDKWIFLEAVPKEGDFVKLQYQYSDRNGITQSPVNIDIGNPFIHSRFLQNRCRIILISCLRMILNIRLLLKPLANWTWYKSFQNSFWFNFGVQKDITSW
jgi:hypothetical protein